MENSDTGFLRNTARRWAWVVGVLIFVGLVAGNYYYVRQATIVTAPSAPGSGSAKDSDLKILSAEIAALEKAWLDATKGGAAPDATALATLDDALKNARTLNRITAGADERERQRLLRLETERANIRAQEMLARIVRLEAEGQAALEADRLADAEAPLREALRLQREVNAGAAAAHYKSSVREAVLQQAVATAESAPVARELDEMLVQARAAAAAGRAAEALAAYRRALTLQGRINRDYPGTFRADKTAEQQLAVEMESVGVAGLRETSETAERAAEVALAAGRASEAAVAFNEARTAQLEINQKYARSPLASPKRAEALEVRRQTAAARPSAQRLAAMNREITDLLRRRETGAAGEKIADAARETERLFATFPKSPELDSALREKITYLDSRRSNLAEIQRLAWADLLPLPSGQPGVALLKNETSQALYVLVAGTNPSRHSGPGLPVESVSWHDAQIFCERLTWLLGATVRLPTEAEFRAALGTSPPAEIWSRDNSGGATQPPGKQPTNTAGFCALLGNVAEWLAADAAADMAPVIGGSYLDPAAAVLRVPVEQRTKNDRARHIGFRFVVERPAATASP